MAYTTTDLIASIKRKASIPISQATFSTQDLVDYMNDELESVITPMIMNVREDFFIAYKDFSVTSSTTDFEIPARAIGMRIRDVVLVDNAGGDESFTNLPRLTLEQISSAGINSANTNNYAYAGFYLEGNTIKLYPATGWGNQTLRVYYFKRPATLVPVNSTGKILSIDSGTSTVTLDYVPSTWTTATVVDAVSPNQPFNNPALELTISNIAGYDVTLSSVSALTVGDYISVTGESPIPQIPVEGHQLLMQGAKIQIMDSLNDERAYNTAVQKYAQMERSFLDTITPRVDGQYKKVVSRNPLFGGGWS